MPHVHDVVVIGDGPAGRALGAACVDVGLDVMVVGADAAWTSTYGTWVDDVPQHAHLIAAEAAIDVVALQHRRLERRYGTFHNRSLRDALDVAPRQVGHVVSVQHLADHARVVLGGSSNLLGRLVVDARGPSVGRDLPVQTAYGVVLAERPAVIDGDAGVLMDWRQPVRGGEPTFLYVVPLAGGHWMVEETSLARRTPMAIDQLRGRLAARLGDDLTDRAVHVEHVHIPMQPGLPQRGALTVAFGAAARYVHPATGYSVAASLRAAPRVAAAAAEVVGEADVRHRSLHVWNAVWPAEQRRARTLHDIGLAALLRLDAGDVQTFFDAFFALPTEQWASYLRIDTTVADVTRAMRAVFSSVPWPVRRRLATASPLPFARLLR
jgi:lycopene beta-cyclase